jgi:hypothetical protein
VSSLFGPSFFVAAGRARSSPCGCGCRRLRIGAAGRRHANGVCNAASAEKDIEPAAAPTARPSRSIRAELAFRKTASNRRRAAAARVVIDGSAIAPVVSQRVRG